MKQQQSLDEHMPYTQKETHFQIRLSILFGTKTTSVQSSFSEELKSQVKINFSTKYFYNPSDFAWTKLQTSKLGTIFL